MISFEPMIQLLQIGWLEMSNVTDFFSPLLHSPMDLI